MSEEKMISRRKLLYGAGVSVAGIAMAGTMGALLTGCSQKAPEVVASPGTDQPQALAAPDFPWQYQKMDIDECQAAAYAKYLEAG